jgi:hypothetical protein
MKRNSAQKIALGGLMAALAIVIMCLGGLIPFATFVCPMLCCMITKVVLSMCGKRIAWAWYGAVAILSVLMAPDKEAAAVFVFLGYYPIVKPWMDKQRLSWLWKGLLFNCAILLMYWLLINILGLSEIANDYEEAGTVITVVMLLLGNVTFFMLDLVLGRRLMRRHG